MNIHESALKYAGPKSKMDRSVSLQLVGMFQKDETKVNYELDSE